MAASSSLNNGNPFAILLRDLRKRAGLSQRALAVLLNVAPATISKVETGRGKTTLAYEQAIAEVVQRALEEITQPSTKAPQDAPPTSEKAQEHSSKSFTDAGDGGIISPPMPHNEVERGDHLTSYTPEQGDPNTAQGTKPPEHGLDKPSNLPKQRRRVRKEATVFQGTRTHYDRDYLEENAQNVVGLVFDAAKSNDPDLSKAAHQVLQSIHVVAESVAKRKGSSLSKVSREHHIPIQSLSNYVRNGLIPTLYKDSKTIYLANQTMEELGRDKQDAEEMGMQLARLLQERRDKYFPREPKS